MVSVACIATLLRFIILYIARLNVFNLSVILINVVAPKKVD
jgi:hypothetical protein